MKGRIDESYPEDDETHAFLPLLQGDVEEVRAAAEATGITVGRVKQCLYAANVLDPKRPPSAPAIWCATHDEARVVQAILEARGVKTEVDGTFITKVPRGGVTAA